MEYGNNVIKHNPTNLEYATQTFAQDSITDLTAASQLTDINSRL